MAKLPHPPFCGDPAPSGGNRDFMTKDGAHELARKTEHAWAKAGHIVQAVIEPIPRKGKVEAHYAVRTPGLVRGLPVRQVPA